MMSAPGNPYEAPRTSVADVEQAIFKRPVPVTVALAILWTLLAMVIFAVAGALSRLGSFDTRVSGLTVYLVALIAIPGFLLVKIAQGRTWARIAAMTFYALDNSFRLFLIWANPAAAQPLSAVIGPAAAEIVAFVLMYLPRSNAWFRSMRPGS